MTRDDHKAAIADAAQLLNLRLAAAYAAGHLPWFIAVIGAEGIAPYTHVGQVDVVDRWGRR